MNINLYLIKDEYSFDDVFEEEEIKETEDYKYIVSSNGGINLPRWFRELEGSLLDNEDIEEIKAQIKNPVTNSFILMKEHEGKKFIFSFGLGYSKIEERFIVDNFGKKICMILVDQYGAKFLSVTNKEVGIKGKSSQTHVQRSENFSDFGLSGENYYLKTLKVKVPRDSFNTSKEIAIEGGKSCKVKIGRDQDINVILDKMIELYEKDIINSELKDIFENIKEIKKPSDFDIFDNTIEFENIYIDHNLSHEKAAEDYKIIIKKRNQEICEVRMSNSFDEIKNKIEASSPEIVSDRKEFLNLNLIYFNENEDQIKKEKLVNSISLTFDYEEENKLIFMNGKYFSISNNYLNKIENELERVETIESLSNLQLNLEEVNSEDDFNQLLSSEEGMNLLDRKLIHFSGNSFEFCDVLNKENKEILHVKGKGSNSITSIECEHWTNQLLYGREVSLEYIDEVFDSISGNTDINEIFLNKEELKEVLRNGTFGLVSFTKSRKELKDFPLFGKIALYNLIKKCRVSSIDLKYFNFHK